MPPKATNNLKTYLQKISLKLKLHCNATTLRLTIANLILIPLAYFLKHNLTTNPKYLPIDINTKTIFYTRILTINTLTAIYSAGIILILIVLLQLASLVIRLKTTKIYKWAKSIWFAALIFTLFGLNIYSFGKAMRLLGG